MSEVFASPVDIASQALVLVGANPITSFQDDVTESILADRLYDNTRRSLLRTYPWVFAQRRVQLVERAEPPLNEFYHSFAYPDSCLRILGVYGNDREVDRRRNLRDLKFTVEGQNVYTWEGGNIFARYIHDVDAEDFDPAFADALAYELAYRFAYPLQASNTLKSDLFAEASQRLDEAKAANNFERPHEKFYAERLNVVRYR